ncbi:MAG: ribosome recycling factor [Candidatus Magasanikbacteria bacterium RIFOXYC2_FULL_40_16]|uniref:Ribosome-recycling factor n=3 Tax=Candidatus Magasanikiibacteriota TaxID=1752731 RepID=A0A1F6NJA8_9BACT|nr:MAG: ribosome recycling factor [Candidatus Magasanikbacteria bacterium RIFOXYA2_FULL_40_20]OGH84021.1 MAG: ribosome recycling factor [Candidatus Magasanikbacteria bacterium RIFOXYB1_FULL_40_15]OGH86878.1 MAG: ribosome recycling factor [Candidatus Magasanikbacteria bacterium RIFOXYB2_FULL_40_13]OGH87941.1 MAG: ribosome recycling factor [Candidatus Magasanikbacteria bacterium RIFOXYA1_FULL_40_8]OGH89225.1 MAG: ribosome recycling factor [Candidatus Magasanikbacteria bacterium RIFOXYC2_FULL_40_1
MSMNIQSYKEQFDKTIEHLKGEMSKLRTGRATPALVEDITVEAYGVKQPLKTLASISISDAKTLNVEPWDKSIIQAIETAINNSQLGINPVNDGKLLRLPLPELTQDRRVELIKVLHQKLEAGRISARQIREEIKKEIEQSEKDKEITEDDRYKYIEDLDKAAKDCNDKIKELGEEKEKEINTV